MNGAIRVTFFAILFFASTVFAGPGQLDSTFGHLGRVTTDFGVANNAGNTIGADYANALAIQSDGKIIAAGITFYDRQGHTKCSAARYNTSGALDASFSGDGKLFAPMDVCVAVLIQSDGKIVFVGEPVIAVRGGNGTMMARYTEEGELDTSFGTDGKVSLPEEYYTIYYNSAGVRNDEPQHQFTITDAALQDDDKIVIAGSNLDPDVEWEQNFLLLRYNANGGVDGSFGSNGMVTTDFDNGFNPDIDGAAAIAISGSGANQKIALTGSSLPFAGDYPNYKFSIAVYDGNGSLEWQNSFSPDVSNNVPHDIAFEPDGQILVVGQSSDNTVHKLTLVRYDSGGGLDPDFGSGGVVRESTLEGSEGTDLLLAGDGSIFALGHSYALDTRTGHIVLMKFTSEGEFDASFGTNGIASTNLGEGILGRALAMQDDGRIIASAVGISSLNYSPTSIQGNFNILRYLTRPTLSIGTARGTEEDGQEVLATFTLTLDTPPNNTVTVDYATSDLSDWGDEGAVEAVDYEAQSGKVIFEAGEISKTINIAIYDDDEMEGEEYFLVTLSSPTNADILSPGAYGIISDNDWPSLSIEDVEVTEGNAGEEQVVVFEITLTRPPASDPSEVITVEYETDSDNADGGADFQETSGTLIFDAGVTSQTVEVTVLGDDEIEDDEYFYLTLYDAEGAQISDGVGEAVIHDNDEEDAGDAGDGGADPGDGGADPGDGGADPGDGGADPGDGGADPGDGGADLGDGGGDDAGDGGDEGDGEEDPAPADDCSSRPFICRGVNPVTGETACPEATADANCDFTLECDQSKLIDPTDESRVIAEINCEYDGALVQTLYDAFASDLDTLDGSTPRLNMGDMDIYDTVSYHLINRQINEIGWRTMREQTSGLGCCQAFAHDLFGNASGSNGNQAMMAAIPQVASCLAGRLPQGYTNSDVYALLTDPDSDADETGSIIDFAIEQCGLPGALKNAIMNGRSALSSVGDLCLSDIAGDQTTCDQISGNADERNAWVNTIHAMDESDLEDYDDTLSDLMDEVRATSDFSLFADDFRIDMLIGLMAGNSIISGLDEDMVDTVMELVRNVPDDGHHELHGAEWYRSAGAALLDLAAGSDDDTLDYLRANAGDIGDMIREQEGETSDDVYGAVSDYLSDRGHGVDDDRAGRHNRGNGHGSR